MKRLVIRGVTAVIVLAAASACSSEPYSSPSPSPSPAATATEGAPAPGVDHTPTPTPSPSMAPSPSTAPSDVHDEPEAAPALPVWDAAAEELAIARAEGFVRAWARPDLDPTTWFAGVQGFLSPAAYGMYEAVDPLMVPATTVTGRGRVDGQPSGTAVTVLVPTDAGQLLVHLVRATGEEPWLVTQLDQAGEPA